MQGAPQERRESHAGFAGEERRKQHSQGEMPPEAKPGVGIFISRFSPRPVVV
jgi:hypothetical protein